MLSKHTALLLLSTFGAALLMARAATRTTTSSSLESYYNALRGDGGGRGRGKNVRDEELIKREKREPFAECVHRPKNKHIFSVDAEMSLFDKEPTYELPLSEFRALLKANDLRRTNFVADLNRVQEVVDTSRGSPFELVYAINNDVLIHRGKAFYGFHVRFDPVTGMPTAKGVLNHYDIVSKYTKE